MLKTWRRDVKQAMIDSGDGESAKSDRSDHRPFGEIFASVGLSSYKLHEPQDGVKLRSGCFMFGSAC